MTKQYSLIVRTDQYTGNIDTFLCGALFGIDDDRYGGAHGVMIYEENISEEDRLLLCEAVESRPNEDYGLTLYKINDDLRDGYNSLEFGIESYAVDDIPAMVEMWRRAYGGEITYRDDITKKDNTIKLLGFHLKTYTITEELEEIA